MGVEGAVSGSDSSGSRKDLPRKVSFEKDDGYLKDKLDRIFEIIITKFAKQWSVYWDFGDHPNSVLRGKASPGTFQEDLMKELISRLDDYCVQKDLDYFISGLPYPDLDITETFIRMFWLRRSSRSFSAGRSGTLSRLAIKNWWPILVWPLSLRSSF
ncbi:hypothetical protein BJX70DRAFT_381221 [Aspergillus crustosus]